MIGATIGWFDDALSFNRSCTFDYLVKLLLFTFSFTFKLFTFTFWSVLYSCLSSCFFAFSLKCWRYHCAFHLLPFEWHSLRQLWESFTSLLKHWKHFFSVRPTTFLLGEETKQSEWFCKLQSNGKDSIQISLILWKF